MGWLLLLFLIGHVVLLYALLEFVDRFKLGMDNLRFSYIMLSLVALLICWSVVWRWTSRRVLRSTAWGRRNVMSGGALNAPATSTQPEPARSGGRAWRIAAAVIVAVVAAELRYRVPRPGPSVFQVPSRVKCFDDARTGKVRRAGGPDSYHHPTGYHPRRHGHCGLCTE